MKIVLGGPPHSGKSCLREALKQAMMAITDAPYPYVITACPDGEGSWHFPAVAHDPENAKKLKADYKGQFTEAFVERISRDVKTCELPLVFIDIGGKTSQENKIICAEATHIILLAGDSDNVKWQDKLVEWRKFAQQLKLKIFAELHSDYKSKSDTILELGKDGIYRGSIHYLERGDLSAKERPTIKQLAQLITEKLNMSSFNIEVENNHKLRIGFGEPAQNDKIVKNVAQRLENMIENQEITGGEIIKINGPASLPVAMVLAHKLGHLYQAIACYDPKLAKYVVAIAHGDLYSVGDLID